MDDDDLSTQEWHWLLDNEPYLAYRMLNLRRMLEHRGLVIEHIAWFINRSREWAYQTIRPSAILIEGELRRNNCISVKVALSRIDDLETGISILTEYEGGVLGICGCTPEAVDELKAELSST